ncbi:MAG: cysteine--tRNA ligase [Candidatus Pacebacteria bacterium]|nr:cysteine--tRNA ligase [Candidatus Paceibacterota bacterium]
MLKIYNSLSNKAEVLKPIDQKKLKLYVCGITVYDSPHIGHARTYIAFDIFAKYLKSKGFAVSYLQNITDIDDKIIKKAQEIHTSWKILTKKFEKECQSAMKALNITFPIKYARATDHIREIVSQISRLVNLEVAYRAEDGIYFDVSTFKNYGKLSKRTAMQAEDSVSKIDDAKNKRNKADFCLWKFYSGIPSEPKWTSPWGPGRPGWHIEDTAITEKYFGPQYDIHGGGRDLIFPHHEAEIAQMETLSDLSPMVRYWMHTGFLMVNGQKMSKSLGNFITIKDFLDKYPSRLLRYYFSKAHYRSPVDYSDKAIEQSENDLRRIDEFIQRLSIQKGKEKNKKIDSILKKSKTGFESAMDNDLNTPQAIAVIFELIKSINQLMDANPLNKSQVKEILETLKGFDNIFNFIFVKLKKKIIPKEIKELAELREKARKSKKWDEADILRKKIEEKGYMIKDIEGGYIIS